MLLLSQFIWTKDGSSRRRAGLPGAGLCTSARLRSTGTRLPAVAVRNALHSAAGYERIRARILSVLQ